MTRREAQQVMWLGDSLGAQVALVFDQLLPSKGGDESLKNKHLDNWTHIKLRQDEQTAVT